MRKAGLPTPEASELRPVYRRKEEPYLGRARFTPTPADPTDRFFLDGIDGNHALAVVPVNRKVKAGKHALLEVFPGLDRSAAFRGIFPDGLREQVLHDCQIDVVPEDMYMYIDDEAGNVVAGLGYLKEGDEKILYLDVLHELTHIRQWHAGKELWDRRYNYVDRPTEIEAYRVAVDEARSLGMTDREIADYLRVEWTSREEHERLCKHLDVRSPESRAV